MNSPGPLGWIAALTLALALSTPAAPPSRAGCASSRDFSGAYTYLTVNGYPTAYYPVELDGVFWALGAGDPQPGAGADSGELEVYAFTPSYGFLAGDWADGGVDGCVDDAGAGPGLDGDECMAVVYSHHFYDPSILLYDGRSFFAVATARARPGSSPVFDFNIPGGPGIDLKPTPVPTIELLEPLGSSVRVTLRAELPAGSALLDPACASGVIAGYEIVAHPVAAGGPDPTGLHLDVEPWTPVSPVTPFGDSVTIELACDGLDDRYLAAAVVFDGGFRAAHASPAATLRIETASDGDGDSIPDACDACHDEDGDALGAPFEPASTCPTDNCPTVSNPSQSDADVDGIGDACDRCYGGTDPLARRLTPAVPTAIALDTSASRAVWIAVDGGAGPELWSAPADAGGTPVRLNDTLAAGGAVEWFAIVPGDATVLFLADLDGSGEAHLWAAPIDGGPTVELSRRHTTHAVVTPDGASAVFRSLETSGALGLSAVAVGGGAPIRLTPTLPAGRAVEPDFTVTADGQRVVYRADADVADTVELYAVPLGGGTSIALNDPLPPGGDVFEFGLSPDGAYVVYRGEQTANGRAELFSVPVDRSLAPVELNGTLAGGEFEQGDVDEFVVASGVVVYTAKEDSFSTEIYGVPIDGSAPSIRLNDPIVPDLLPEMQGVRQFAVTPDGTRAVWSGDLRADERVELFAAPVDGGGPPLVLATEPGVVADPQLSPDGGRVVFRADRDLPDRVALYAVPVDGGASPRISRALPLDRDVAAAPPGFSGALALYLADPDAPGDLGLFGVPLDGPGSGLRYDAGATGSVAPDPAPVATAERVLFVTGDGLWSAEADCVGPFVFPCGSDEDCEPEEYCRFDDGDCAGDGAPGICVSSDVTCSGEFDPVCGCDGMTYPNACNAQLAGISLLARRECAPCTSTSCGAATYCPLDAGDCDGTAAVCVDSPSCPAVCAPPVCGCDGVTYAGECQAASFGSSIAHPGVCDEPTDGLITGVHFESPESLAWNEETSASSYNVYRRSGAPPPLGAGSCEAAGLTIPSASVPLAPAPGELWLFQVAAVVAGEEQWLGSDSACRDRIPDAACGP